MLTRAASPCKAHPSRGRRPRSVESLTSSASRHKRTGVTMMMDAQAEIAKLQEKLALCQQELAQVRRQQEEVAQSTSSNDSATVKLRQVSTRPAQRLDRGESVSGRRGWIKRRVLSSMPRSEEDADLAVLRSSKLMNGPWLPPVLPRGRLDRPEPSSALPAQRSCRAEESGTGLQPSTSLTQHPDVPSGTNPLVHFTRPIARRHREGGRRLPDRADLAPTSS